MKVSLIKLKMLKSKMTMFKSFNRVLKMDWVTFLLRNLKILRKLSNRCEHKFHTQKANSSILLGAINWEWTTLAKLKAKMGRFHTQSKYKLKQKWYLLKIWKLKEKLAHKKFTSYFSIYLILITVSNNYQAILIWIMIVLFLLVSSIYNNYLYNQ